MTTTRPRLLLFWPLAACLGAFALAACFGPKATEDAADERFLNLAPEVGYVGAAACESCHSEIYASYQDHGMAQSFYPLTDETVVETFPSPVVTHNASGYTYQAVREGDRWVQEETKLGASGEALSRQRRTIDYVVGSGSAARTYLTRDSTGRLYELPLTWYTQANDGAGKWDFSPGYDVLNSRFDRTIPERCMACHNGTSESVPFTDGQYTSLAMGIGCEQCHGPGELHVNARTEDPEAPDSMDVTIVNPKWLSLDLRLDVCQQCHLSAEVSFLREGETATSYRPGRPLAAHRSLFAPENDDPTKVDVISHADRMKQSACFQESVAMDCVTCHNPHDAVPTEETFSATCRSCHAPEALQAQMPTPELKAQHATGQTCISCHMPKVEAADAPHSSFTDHLVRVVDSEIEGVAMASGGGLRAVFARDEDDEVAQGMAYVLLGQNEGSRETLASGVDRLAAALERTPEAGEAQFLLGFARLKLNKPEDAIAPLEAAVAMEANPERLNALAEAYERAGRAPGPTDRLYQQALQIQPAAAGVRVNYGRFLEAQGRVDDALRTYQQALAAEPWNGIAYYNLGTLLARQGDASGAIQRLREAIRLLPTHGDALTNLGVLLAQQGNESEAGPLLIRAVEAEPRNANAQANLALYYLNTGDTRGALDRARQALQLNPGQQTAQQVLAILQQNGIG